jgi:hypothetical protein
MTKISFSSNTLDILLCLFASLLFYQIAIWHIEFAMFNAEYTPAFPDSFYHATRILDSIQHGGLLQFDPKIHAPEGAWIVWPWGYDWFIARIIELVMFTTGINPVKIMVHIPPLWGIVNIALMVSLCRTLQLLFPYRIIVILCFVLLPLNQQLHVIGRIDHHYMELTMVLLSTILSLQWFRFPESKLYAISIGAVLGGSMAIHNSMFVLQAPVIASLMIYWLLAKPLPKTTLYFSSSLLFFTLLFLIPSETFREYTFSFYHYSFFHLYISFCVAFFAFILFKISLCKKNISIIIALLIIFAFPLVKILISGYDFISGDIEFLTSMGEVKSFLSFNPAQRISLVEAVSNYSAYICLLPLTLGYILYLVCNKTELNQIYFTLFSLMAVFFLLKQVRFHYFGSFILYIPLALLFQNSSHLVKAKNIRLFIFLLTTLLAYSLPAKSLFKEQPRSQVFEATYWASLELKRQCDNDTGIILAPAEVGHYLRYFTNCSIVANSFIMDSQDIKYLRKTKQLLDMNSQQLHAYQEDIKYVFLIREDNIYMGLSDKEVDSINSRLTKELILSDLFPNNYELLFEIKVDIKNKQYVFARAFKIIR